ISLLLSSDSIRLEQDETYANQVASLSALALFWFLFLSFQSSDRLISASSSSLAAFALIFRSSCILSSSCRRRSFCALLLVSISSRCFLYSVLSTATFLASSISSCRIDYLQGRNEKYAGLRTYLLF